MHVKNTWDLKHHFKTHTLIITTSNVRYKVYNCQRYTIGGKTKTNVSTSCTSIVNMWKKIRYTKVSSLRHRNTEANIFYLFSWALSPTKIWSDSLITFSNNFHKRFCCIVDNIAENVFYARIISIHCLP